MPELDVPLEEAVKDLTGFEVLGIETHYKASMENLGGTRLLIGTVYCYENRNGTEQTWRTVEGYTIRRLTEYFANSDPDVDSDQGKESTELTSERENSPIGV